MVAYGLQKRACVRESGVLCRGVCLHLHLVCLPHCLGLCVNAVSFCYAQQYLLFVPGQDCPFE